MIRIKNNKIIFSIAVISVIVIVVSAILMITPLQPKSNRPLLIGIDGWIGFATLHIAEEKFFKENNVDVKLILNDKDYTDRFQAFVDGELDGIAGVYTDFIYGEAHGVHSKIVYVNDYSGTGDAIVGNVSTVSELKGKKIGIEGINTFSHLFVLNVLEESGLNEGDVEFVIVPHSETIAAFEENKVQAAHAWDPVKTELIKKGYRIITTAKSTPGIITDVTGFNPEYVEKNPEKIQGVINSLNQANEFLNTHQDEAIQIVAKRLNTTSDDIKNRLAGSHILNLQENIHAMKKSDSLNSLYGSGQYIGEKLLERGQISRIPNFDILLEPKFIESVKP